ncbi:uncharacterized protein LOC120332222 [Styela clava]
MNKLHLLIVLTICSLAAVGSEARHIQNDVARLCQPTPLSTIQKGINCSCSAHHSLQSIPRQNDWQKNGLVLTIRLHGCRDIGSIGKELSTYHDLKTLDIQGSGIKKLENGAMIFNINITTLIITNSKISRIEPNAFIGISKLRYLDLSGNKIDNLPVEAFKEIRTLQTLNLDGNKIDFIGKEIFVRLSSLQSLSLRGNKISTIDPDAFQNTLLLGEIFLDNNVITNLDFTSFVGLPELITLSVTNNKITKLTVPCEGNGVYDTNVDGNENCSPAKLILKILNMANNDMTVLSDKFIQAMPFIEYFDVSDNSLTYIGGNAISKLRNLKVLNISGNELISPNVEWVLPIRENGAGFESDLSNNPWICNCETAKYQAFILANGNNGMVASLNVECTPKSEKEYREYQQCLNPKGEETTSAATTTYGITSSELPTVRPAHDNISFELTTARPAHDNTSSELTTADDTLNQSEYYTNSILSAILILLCLVVIGFNIYFWKFRPQQQVYRDGRIIAEYIQSIRISRSHSPRSSPALSEASSGLLDTEGGPRENVV